MKYKKTEKQLITPENIRCTFSVIERTKDAIAVLLISFSGNYPEGSLGNTHARYISRNVLAGIIEFDPDAILLDFSALTYSWGNAILRVFTEISLFKDGENTVDEPNFPVIVLVSEISKNGIISLLTPSTATTKPSFIFENLDAAIDAAFIKGAYWLNY